MQNIEQQVTYFGPVKVHDVLADQIKKNRAKWKADLKPVDYAANREAIKEWEKRHREVVDRHKKIRQKLKEELNALEAARPLLALPNNDYARKMLIETAPNELQKMRDEELRILRDVTHDSFGDERMLYLRSRLRNAELSENAERYRDIRKLIDSIERNCEPINERILKIEERMVNA